MPYLSETTKVEGKAGSDGSKEAMFQAESDPNFTQLGQSKSSFLVIYLQKHYVGCLCSGSSQ